MESMPVTGADPKADFKLECDIHQSSELLELCEAISQPADGAVSRQVKRRICRLIERDPRAALLALAPILDSAAGDSVVATVRRTIRSIPSYASYLCDARRFDIGQSVRLFQLLGGDEAYVDVEVAQAAADLANAGDNASALLALSVLEELAQSGRVTPILISSMKARDGYVRSKAATIFAKLCANLERIKARIADAEPRVRANIVESMSESPFDGAELREFFQVFTEDSNHRVAANSLLRLYRMGSVDLARSRLCVMARHESGNFRTSAAWAMGQTGDSGFHTVLESLRSDVEPAVRWSALRALVHLWKNRRLVVR